MSIVTDPDRLRKEKLTQMMTQYEKDLLRLCCVYLRDAALAEDAVQETFIKAYKKMNSFRGESSERTWLYAIAANVCRDIRRLAWYRYVDRRIDFDQLPIPVEEAKDTSIALMTEVMRLPRKYMEVIWLYFYEDMNLKEVGELLGITPSAVSHRLMKAKKMLGSALKGEMDDER